MSTPSSRTPNDVLTYYKAKRYPDVVSASQMHGDSLQSWNSRLGALSVGSATPDFITAVGPTDVSLVEAVTVCDTTTSPGAITVTLPDPALVAGQCVVKNGFVKTVVHTAGLLGVDVFEAISGVTTTLATGASATWIYERGAWIVLAGSSVPPSAVDLGTVIHTAVAQSTSSNGLYTTNDAWIYGRRAVLNLDDGLTSQSTRLAALAPTPTTTPLGGGSVGLHGVSYDATSAPGLFGESITVQGGSTRALGAQGGDVTIEGGEGNDTVGGSVFIVGGGVVDPLASGGRISIDTVSGNRKSGNISATTGDSGDQSGHIECTTGQSQNPSEGTGFIRLITGEPTGGFLGATSGDILLMTGQNANANGADTGPIVIESGEVTQTNSVGTSGRIRVYTGNAVFQSGALQIKSGNIEDSFGLGAGSSTGLVSIESGDCITTGRSGPILISSGDCSGALSNVSGFVTVESGFTTLAATSSGLLNFRTGQVTGGGSKSGSVYLDCGNSNTAYNSGITPGDRVGEVVIGPLSVLSNDTAMGRHVIVKQTTLPEVTDDAGAGVTMSGGSSDTCGVILIPAPFNGTISLSFISGYNGNPVVVITPAFITLPPVATAPTPYLSAVNVAGFAITVSGNFCPSHIHYHVLGVAEH